MKKLGIILSASLFLFSTAMQAAFKPSSRFLMTSHKVQKIIYGNPSSFSNHNTHKPNLVLLEAYKRAISNNPEKADELWTIGQALQRHFRDNSNIAKFETEILKADERSITKLACAANQGIYTANLHLLLHKMLEEKETPKK